ncbi:MAG TPA: PA14 domain-containing protein, partial [Minicystis sp.]|nr:PA14 domain-containing protein [Minicystis sp.]
QLAEVPRRRHRPQPRVDVAPRVTTTTLFGDGNGGAFRGLVYLMPDDAETLPDFSRLQPIGEVFTDKFNVAPQPFRGGFPGVSKEEEWFAIRYDGNFFLPEGGPWRFRLVSDDGSALYVDGHKVLSNDGVHGPRSVRGTADLAPGRHHLRLEYFQGNKGPVALQLFAAAPSAPNAEFILGSR